MKILGLIPARGESKGIPRKNIKLLGGKPLLQYTFDSAQVSSLLSNIVLSTDDQEIMGTAKSFGLEVPFIRPSELAEDDTSSLEVVQHALHFFEEKGEKYDAVCLLQPTSPFRKAGLIDQAIKHFENGGYDSLISVREVPAEYNPHWIFEEKNGSLKISTGETEIISRRQELPNAYQRDGAIYITKASVLLEENSLYGKKIGFIDTTGSPHVNIDVPKDWEEAEKIISEPAQGE